MLEVGLKGVSQKVVEEADSAVSQHSGDLYVFSTPSLIALMENAACAALEGHLPEGATTVGIHIACDHVAATPVGMQVWAEAEVTAFDGKGISFDITAYDQAGQIGIAQHRRFAVITDRFMSKVNGKLTTQ